MPANIERRWMTRLKHNRIGPPTFACTCACIRTYGMKIRTAIHSCFTVVQFIIRRYISSCQVVKIDRSVGMWNSRTQWYFSVNTWMASFSRHFFKCISLNEFLYILIEIVMKFVTNGPLNIPALMQITAWRRPGDKRLFEPMAVSIPTHTCVNYSQMSSAIKFRKHWAWNNGS